MTTISSDQKSDCEHDFLSILHCKKCGEQYHVKWEEALKQAKLDAVAEVLQRTKSTLKIRAKKESEEKAIEVAQSAIEEVKKVYEQALETNDRKDVQLNLKILTPSN